MTTKPWEETILGRATAPLEEVAEARSRSIAEGAGGKSRPSSDDLMATMAAHAAQPERRLLSPVERKALALTGELWQALCELVGDGPTRSDDLREPVQPDPLAPEPLSLASIAERFDDASERMHRTTEGVVFVPDDALHPLTCPQHVGVFRLNDGGIRLLWPCGTFAELGPDALRMRATREVLKGMHDAKVNDVRWVRLAPDDDAALQGDPPLVSATTELLLSGLCPVPEAVGSVLGEPLAMWACGRRRIRPDDLELWPASNDLAGWRALHDSPLTTAPERQCTSNPRARVAARDSESPTISTFAGRPEGYGVTDDAQKFMWQWREALQQAVASKRRWFF